MTEFLTICIGISLLLALGTTLCIVLPPCRGEVRFWRRHNVQGWRRRATEWRNPNQPLEPTVTLRSAKTNLAWHLFLTLLFCILMARARFQSNEWLRALASSLIVPCLAYSLGSVIQRQKIAVLTLRSSHPRGAVEGTDEPGH